MKNLISNNIDKFKFYENGDENLYDDFLKMWNNAKTSIFKFEAQQYYESDEEMYQCFINNDFDKLIKDLADYWNEEKIGLYKNIFKKKILFKRLHLVKKPLTEYLKSEYYSYVASELIGEKIKIIDKNTLVDLDEFEFLDFLIFDDTGMLMTEYDENNKIIGDWISYDKDLIYSITDVFLKGYNQGYNFRKMYKGNKNIEKRIIEKLNV